MKRKDILIIILISVIVIILFLFIIFFSFLFIINSHFKKEVQIFVGDPLPVVKKYVDVDYIDLKFSDSYYKIDTNIPGNYSVNINWYFLNFSSKLKIIDNISPIGIIKNIELPIGNYVNAIDFFYKIEDNSKVKAYFLKEPNFNILGEQIVDIILEDSYRNKSKFKAKLKIYEDHIAPSFFGIHDIYINAGQTPYYRNGVSVKDNFDKNIDYDVDLSAVNLNKEGIYPIYYIAKDRANNITKIEANIIVNGYYTNSDLDVKLDNELNFIIKNIINENMTFLEKLKAIYDYVNKNIMYTENKKGTNFKEFAYYGLTEKKGDCYNFTASSKYLLDKLGVESKYIQRINTASMHHFWLIVKYNNQWYHFDPLNVNIRNDFKCFMKTDDEVMEFSKKVSNIIDNYYVYDKDKYPEISNEKIEL